MSGTKKGAMKRQKTILEAYGPDAQARWGHKGGIARNKSGKKYSPFVADPEFARVAGLEGSKKRWAAKS